ncbi:MAG: response regulator [Verrucomicrobium sp.]|nr:response regulator [Verrucomicrobium sp.]
MDLTRAEPPRILVVDDSQSNLDISAYFLEWEGYRVLRAMDGRTALHLLDTERPDLVVTDIELPDMDGLSLLQHIRANARTRDIPVVALTGHDERTYQERMLAAGCTAYLIKPIDTRTFSQCISRHLPLR